MFNELLETHLPYVFRFALHLLRDHHAAQDVAQETMLRAWRDRRKLRQLDSARSWVLRIAANLCKDYSRRIAHRVGSPESLDNDPLSRQGEPWESLSLNEKQVEINDLMDSLAAREKTVLYLSAFEQLTNPEIAEVLQIEVGAVKVALSRARKSIRNRLAEKEKKETKHDAV